MASESDYARLDEPRKPRLLKFDPTVSSGSLLTLVALIGGFITFYTQLQTERATTRMELDSVKAAAVSEKAATRESLTEIKGDVKDVQRTLGQVTQTLAVIEARQAAQKEKP